MVLGTDTLNWYKPTSSQVSKNPFAGKVEKQPYQQGVNYAQFDGGTKPNYEQYDVYRSPVTTGRSGDNFDMKM